MMLMIAGLLGVMAAGAALIGFDLGSDDDDLTTDPEAETSEDTDSVTDDANGGSGLDDVLSGTDSTPNEDPAGDQVIAGTEDDQTLTGGDGNDSLHGYAGDDVVAGLDGNDELHGGAGEDTVQGGQGNDTLHGEDGNDSLFGGDGDDQMFGHNDDDTLFGNDGDDSLVGSAGDDHLFGGTGNDALHGDLDNDRLAGGAGQDTLFGGVGDDLIVGDDDAEMDFLNGGEGNDTLIGGGGDYIHSGEGNDLILIGDWVENPTTVLDFDPGADQIAVMLDDPSGPAPDISVSEPDETTGHVSILVNGQQVATINGAAGLTVADIALIARPA